MEEEEKCRDGGVGKEKWKDGGVAELFTGIFFNNKSAGALFPGGKWKIVAPNAKMISSKKLRGK